MRKLTTMLMAITLMVAASISTVRAQATPSTTTTPTRLETQLLKTIVFITLRVKEPDRPRQPSKPFDLFGTGFLVHVPDDRLPKDKTFAYLVTNRHVAEAIEQDKNGHCRRLQILKTYVTLNLKEPVNGNRLDKVPINFSQEEHWYFARDEAIDLAVIPVRIADKYDYRLISTDQFLTSTALDQQQVVPGDRVLTGGYFWGYTGLHEIQPILREGVLAMLPDGPMMTTTCKMGNIYMADVHIIPGNSGFPMFVIPALGLGANVGLSGVPNTFGLLGVVSGYMYENESLTLRASTTWTGSVRADSGISVVVPAQQLKDLLYTAELQHLRDVASALQK